VQKKEGSVLQLLGKMESDLEKKNRQLKQANSKLDAILAEMTKEEAEVERIHASISAKQQRLIERAVALYRWHRSGSPFVILNGSVSFGGLLQRARYLQTTVLFDSDLIEKLHQEAEAQENLKTRLAQRKEDLDRQRQVLTEATDSVRKEAEKKKEMLASLRQENDG
jgi:peptidoglycan hydrolase CwlO-like protein